VSEKSFAWRQAGLVRRHKRAVGTVLISLGAWQIRCVESGRTYDALVSGPNRKFWLKSSPHDLPRLGVS
jgi:hypothetical protein